VRYYVIANDGQKYGPADVQTLNQWVVEGRLLPNQMLENEASGERVPASAVPGLNFAQSQPTAAPGPAPTGGYGGGQPYQQHYQRPGGDGGQGDVTQGWILFGVGLLMQCCCPIIAIATAVFGMKAGDRATEAGNPAGNTVKVANIVIIVISVISILIGIVLGITGRGFPMPR
jgi:hypothetical protein